MRIPEGWTGEVIQRLRLALGMTVPQFAQLLGVHLATAYRWESLGPQQVRLDSLQSSLLARINQALAARQEQEQQAWRESLLNGLLVGGTLAGLALLLEELLPDKKPAPRRTRKSRPRRKS